MTAGTTEYKIARYENLGFVPSSGLNSYATAALSRYLAKAARESDPWI